MDSRKSRTLKGSIWWGPAYALSTLKNHGIRNLGIALVLAVSISIPTTIFVWTDTGTQLAVNEYFEQNAYQFRLRLRSGAIDYSGLEGAIDYLENSPLVEHAEMIPSSVGIHVGNTIPEWEEYFVAGMNYAAGIHDTRAVLVTNELLSAWSIELEWRGNFSLNLGEVLVSEYFVRMAYELHGIEVNLGTTIDLDYLPHKAVKAPKDYNPYATPSELGRIRIHQLTVVGIYDVVGVSDLSQAFPSFLRINWSPFEGEDPVMGLFDSVLMLQEQVGQTIVEDSTHNGILSPAGLMRASKEGIVEAGIKSVGSNLLKLKNQVEERYPDVLVIGMQNIWALQAHITIYFESQVLVVLALPVMIMGLMLAIFTSESSISYRKGEISALRSKGASFNQIFSSVIWESVILSLLGLIFGSALSFIMAPLMESSNGLLSFDMDIYQTFLSNMTLPIHALILAIAMAFYLPAAYILHVARRIDVSEVGQPTTRAAYEVPEETSIWRYAMGLGAVLSVLMIVPLLFTPNVSIALYEILFATGLLFVSSYLGSRAMSLVTARAAEKSRILLGEKKLYLTQSLRRRKSQFIPLLVILTLTLTTTTMMLIQTSSLELTLDNEMQYALGADLRIVCDNKPLNFTDYLLNQPGVVNVTPVIQIQAQVGTDVFFVEGLDALRYLNVAKFAPDSFVTGSPESVLAALANKQNGIVISEFYANFWGHNVGDSIIVELQTIDSTQTVSFEIMGLMRNAPGFGKASTSELGGIPFGGYFGFQPGGGGFAFVNLEYLSEVMSRDYSRLFLVDTTSLDDVENLIDDLEDEHNTFAYTRESLDIMSWPRIQKFLSGVQGLTMISYILSAAMGLFAIGLFLSSAVRERESEYAVFRALGGTKRQILSMVFGEFAGIVLASITISLFLGLLFGYVMTMFTMGLSAIFPILPEVLAFPIFMMAVTILLESGVMIASCYLPARKASSTDPASVLRNL